MSVNRCRICKSKLGTRNHTSRMKTNTGLCVSCLRNPIEGEQCVGITSKGVRCKLRKYKDAQYCKVHMWMCNDA
jgi:hypothetical protein